MGGKNIDATSATNDATANHIDTNCIVKTSAKTDTINNIIHSHT